MAKYSWLFMVCAVVGFSLGACGADDDDDGQAGSGGSAGIGGTGGVAGSKPMGGTGGSGAMMTGVPCGGTTCMGSGLLAAIPIMIQGLPQPCCLDASMNKCGIMTTGACMPPPPPAMNDPRCPTVPGPSSMPACCINDMCGQNASILGLGCVENAMAAQMLMGLPFPVMVPPPQRCDAPPPDAGMMSDQDAGS